MASLTGKHSSSLLDGAMVSVKVEKTTLPSPGIKRVRYLITSPENGVPIASLLESTYTIPSLTVPNQYIKHKVSLWKSLEYVFVSFFRHSQGGRALVSLSPFRIPVSYLHNVSPVDLQNFSKYTVGFFFNFLRVILIKVVMVVFCFVFSLQ